MKKQVKAIVTLVVVIGLAALVVNAQPTGPVGIPRVQTTARFTGSGLSTNRLELNIAGASCSAGSAVGSINAIGSGACVAVGTGTVTSLDSGAGLTGGPVTTTGTFAVGAGTNITVNADDVQVANAFDQSASGKSTTVGDLRGTVITPTLSGDTNNWAPTGIATATVIEVTQSGGSWTITGLTTGVTGRFILISNVSGNGNELLIKHNSGSSSAGNKFWNTGLQDTRVSDGSGVWYHYDGALWRQTEQEYAQNFKVNGQLVVNGTSGTTILGGTTSLGAITGTIAVNNSGSLSVGDFRTTRLTATVSGDQTDYAPTNFATAFWWDLTMSGADRSISGIAGGVTGRRIFIRNVSGSLGFGLTIVGNAGSAGNKVFVSDSSTGAGNLALREGDGVELMYDGTEWVQVGQTNGVNTQNASLSATISGDQTEYAPTGYLNSNFWFISPSGGARIIRGIAGGVNNRIIRIFNPAGTGQTLVLSGEDGSNPTLANRLKTADGNNGASATFLSPGTGTEFAYSTSNNRWNELDRTQSYNYITNNNMTSQGTVTVAGLMNAGTMQATTTSMQGPVFMFATTSSLAADQDNWTPTSFNVSVGTQLVPSGADRKITGMTSGTTTRWAWLWNASTTLKVTLTHQDGASTAANRFLLPGAIDYVIRPEATVTLYYGADARWHVFGDNPPATTITSTISTDTADWAPTGIEEARTISATVSGGTWQLSGITGGFEGRRLTVRVDSLAGGSWLYVNCEGAASVAANRIVGCDLHTSFALGAGGSVELVYVGGSKNRWEVASIWSDVFYGLRSISELTVDSTATIHDEAVGQTLSVGGLATLSGGLTTPINVTTTGGGYQADTGTLPTISSCGTGATRTGGRYSGTITVGTGATGCVITYALLSGTPSCIVTSEANKHITYTVSTTAITITNVDDTSSTLIDFDCKGH